MTMNSALNSPLAEQAQAQIDAINGQIGSFVTQAQTDSWYLIKTAGAGIQSVNGQVLFLSAITLAIAPSNAGHATNKQYVDQQVNFLTTLITDLQAKVAQNITDIATLQSNDVDLYARIATLNQQVIDLQAAQVQLQIQIDDLAAEQDDQNQAIANLNTRVTNLENQAGRGAPMIGNMVHVRDADDHCQPAIVYEDWKGTNGTGVISVVAINPVRLDQSDWFSKIEVHPEVGIELPFTAWHWPETSFPPAQRMFARLTK